MTNGGSGSGTADTKVRKESSTDRGKPPGHGKHFGFKLGMWGVSTVF